MTARRKPPRPEPGRDPRNGTRGRGLVPRLLAALFLAAAVAVPAAATGLVHARAPAAPAVRQRRKEGIGWNRTGCMQRFMDKKHKHEFGDCRKRICFLFLQEEPYIILDPAMTSVAQQFPFNCSTIPRAFRRLRGTAFNIMKRTAAVDGMCAWAGADCGFNHLVDFVAHHSEYESEYHFAITGLLLEFEDRLGTHLAPSVSLLQEQLSIIGPRDVRDDPFPYHRLTRPFQTGAWALFIALMVSYALFAAGMAVVFGPRPVSIAGIFMFYCGDYTEADVARTTAAPQPTPPNTAVNSADHGSGGVLQKAITRLSSLRRREALDTPPEAAPMPDEVSEEDAEKLHQDYVSRVVSRLANYRVARRLLQVALSATAVVFLLFYEISVTNFLFIEQSKPRIQSVEKLNREKLSRYSIQKNAATEVVWHRTVDPEGRYNESTYPWFRCRTEIECFEWIFDDSHDAKLFVGFKTIGTYQVVSRGACENMSIYETNKQLYTFGAGWLYGGSVPEDMRREIDVKVLELQVTDKLRKLVEDDIGSLDKMACTPPMIQDIDVGIIGTSILVFVAPCLVLFVGIILYYCYRKSRMKGSSARPRQVVRTTEARMSHAQITQFCESQLGSAARRRSGNSSALPSGIVHLAPGALGGGE